MSKWWKSAAKDPVAKKPNVLELADTLRKSPGFMARLLNDRDGIEKLEDKHPFNTFVEILLGIIALSTALTAIVTTTSEILQGIAALKELGWIR